MDRRTHKLNQREFDLRDVFKTIYQYKWSIMFITFLTLFMAAFFLYFKPDIYSSHALEVDIKRYI